MGNCISLKSDEEDIFQTSSSQIHSPHVSQTSPPITQRENGRNFFPEIYTIPIQQRETIDSNGFIVLSKNPHLSYKGSSIIQNDDFLGKIYLGQLSDKKVALKEFNNKQTMDCEAAFLSVLDHNNIIKFLMKFDALNQRFFMVNEFADKLSRGLHLKNDLHKRDAMMQLTSAVAYLQNLKIVHCLIIPESIFITNNGSSCTYKLGNFTKAKQIKGETSSVHNEYIENFTAPEIIGRAMLCLASDIWSLACLFFFIASNQKMFSVIYENQMGRIIARIKTVKGESTSIILLRDLLTKMFKFQPNERPSANDVQKHPYFWDGKEMTDFIVDISRFIERDTSQLSKNLNKGYSKGSHRVFGESWTARIDEAVLTELQVIKKSYKANNNRGKSKDDFNEKSIRSLINTIRNIIVHARSPEIVRYMGDTDEQLMDYWNGKFPYLIEHIYNAKLQFENGENVK